MIIRVIPEKFLRRRLVILADSLMLKDSENCQEENLHIQSK